MKGWVIGAALVAAAAAPAARAEEKSRLERSADTVLFAMPVAAFALTFVLDEAADRNGGNGLLGFDLVRMTGQPRHDLGLALLRTQAVSYGLKATVDNPRPNGEDGGFPSGHTAVTFAGAEFIRKHYGWAYGLPAYVVAGFVGWSRVETGDHYWGQVAAGAALGIAANYDFADVSAALPFSARPALFTAGAGDDSLPGQSGETTPGLRFELRF